MKFYKHRVYPFLNVCKQTLYEAFLRTGYLNVGKRANVLLLLTQKKTLAVGAEDAEAVCEGKSMPPKLTW